MLREDARESAGENEGEGMLIVVDASVINFHLWTQKSTLVNNRDDMSSAVEFSFILRSRKSFSKNCGRGLGEKSY